MEKAFTQIDRQKVAWQKIGKGRPLLLLHGWGSSSDVMRRLAEQLATVRTCYLIDFPGFGASPEPEEGWSVGDYAELTSRFISEMLADEEPVDILAHSYGGRDSIKLLSDDQNPVRERVGKVMFTRSGCLKPKRSLSYNVSNYSAKSLNTPFLHLPGSLRDR